MKIEHVALYCLDLEGMRCFFMRHFGCASNDLYHNPRTGLRTYILTFPDGGARLEIMARPEVTAVTSGVFRGGFIHLSLAMGSRAAVDAKVRELAADGCQCLDGPRVTGDGYYEAQVLGPEQLLLEITV